MKFTLYTMTQDDFFGTCQAGDDAGVYYDCAADIPRILKRFPKTPHEEVVVEAPSYTEAYAMADGRCASSQALWYVQVLP